MRKVTVLFLASTLMAMSCNTSQNQVNIQPETGNLDIPAKGELRVWKDLKHAGFDVVLTNNNPARLVTTYQTPNRRTPNIERKRCFWFYEKPKAGHSFDIRYSAVRYSIFYFTIFCTTERFPSA